MGTGAMAVPVPLKQPLPLRPIAVEAHLWSRAGLRRGCRRRLAVSEADTRDTQIHYREAAYLLIQEQERLAIQRVMDQQLCGDPC